LTKLSISKCTFHSCNSHITKNAPQ